MVLLKKIFQNFTSQKFAQKLLDNGCYLLKIILGILIFLCTSRNAFLLYQQ